MKYLTAYSRRQEEGGGSLLLQEYLCRGIPACFACLCSGGEGGSGRQTTEQALAWNRRFPWHRAVRDPERWLEQARRELEEEVRGDRWRIFLCLGQAFLTFGNGCEISLLHASFGRGGAQKLGGSLQGYLEPGAGILLAEEGFLEGTAKQDLEQFFRPWEIQTQTQAAKRFKELNQSGRTGILLIAKEGSAD